MYLKTVITTIISLSLAGGALAQDKIFQSNGNVIEAKIKQISGNNIIYRHWNNRFGPEYSLSTQEVDKIRYENGTEETFSNENTGHNDGNGYRPGRYHSAHRDVQKAPFGTNILSIAPIQFTENGVGVAFSYEKGIDKGGIIAYVLPVMATFNLNNQTETGYNKHQDGMFYFSPGLKFYPTSSYGTLKYAIGPSLVIGAGEKTTGGESYQYGYFGGSPYFEPYQTHTKFILGIIVNNSININPSPNLSLGMDLGFGFTYVNTLGGINQGVAGMIQGGFKIGYRF